jgi:hypothetical protein
MTKRSIFIVICFVLTGTGLLAWQRTTSGQAEPQVAAPAAPSNPRGMPLGGEVTVYLRGDATGMTANNRVIDLSNLVNIKGTLDAGGDHWIVLKADDGKRDWFPIDAVAAVVAEK